MDLLFDIIIFGAIGVLLFIKIPFTVKLVITIVLAIFYGFMTFYFNNKGGGSDVDKTL